MQGPRRHKSKLLVRQTRRFICTIGSASLYRRCFITSWAATPSLNKQQHYRCVRNTIASSAAQQLVHTGAGLQVSWTKSSCPISLSPRAQASSGGLDGSSAKSAAAPAIKSFAQTAATCVKLLVHGAARRLWSARWMASAQAPSSSIFSTISSASSQSCSLHAASTARIRALVGACAKCYKKTLREDQRSVPCAQCRPSCQRRPETALPDARQARKCIAAGTRWERATLTLVTRQRS